LFSFEEEVLFERSRGFSQITSEESVVIRTWNFKLRFSTTNCSFDKVGEIISIAFFMVGRESFQDISIIAEYSYLFVLRAFYKDKRLINHPGLRGK